MKTWNQAKDVDAIADAINHIWATAAHEIEDEFFPVDCDVAWRLFGQAMAQFRDALLKECELTDEREDAQA